MWTAQGRERARAPCEREQPGRGRGIGGRPGGWARCCGWPWIEGKDQSYVLSALAPESLARLRFPLGECTSRGCAKSQSRRGLAVARGRDSQDLCFLAGTRQAAFLARHGGLGRRPG